MKFWLVDHHTECFACTYFLAKSQEVLSHGEELL